MRESCRYRENVILLYYYRITFIVWSTVYFNPFFFIQMDYNHKHNSYTSILHVLFIHLCNLYHIFLRYSLESAWRYGNISWSLSVHASLEMNRKWIKSCLLVEGWISGKIIRSSVPQASLAAWAGASLVSFVDLLWLMPGSESRWAAAKSQHRK